MKLLVNGAEKFPVYVRVNLRRGNIGVSEHFLNRSEVSSALEQMGRERMP